MTTIFNFMIKPKWLHRLVTWHSYPGGFWVRVMGRGISIENKQKCRPLFSERNGYRRIVRFGRWGAESIQLMNTTMNCTAPKENL